MQRSRLLQLALPLVREHGFTREALARSVLCLPEPHPEPLSDPTVSVLFGEGNSARRTLITAWLDEGRMSMRKQPSTSVKDVLGNRLRYNEPVLPLLPEAFALLVSPTSGLPPLDVRPALRHTASIADEACQIVGDASVGPSWYVRRASLAAIYSAAELHQLTSPETAHAFLDSLLASATSIHNAVNETEIFSRSSSPKAGAHGMKNSLLATPSR
ncbi:hypothetical protein EW146_g5127 [Bondarzewia mesenterica]|uniref:COQ9 C-terminal domain-containing protein n=1 Tax=Bondarzewia mesenterica TaxID=1095465 RepID=A0A4S4LSH4_9AGAM|nr:hypothetical protein EW146_g5127 [Bondarzewia mesenterica]